MTNNKMKQRVGSSTLRTFTLTVNYFFLALIINSAIIADRSAEDYTEAMIGLVFFAIPILVSTVYVHITKTKN